MTNAEVAAYFASLPPDAEAEILVLNIDTESAIREIIEAPQTDFDQMGEWEFDEQDKKMLTVSLKW